MKQDGKCPPDLYDPTVKTTVDRVQAAIRNPGRLVATSGEGDTVVELDQPLILIGNDPAADIVVKDTRTSDYIAEITYEKEFYILRRLEQRAIVVVGDKPVTEHILADGDEIRLAERAYVFRAPVPDHPAEG